MSNANEPANPAIETRPAYDDYRNLYAETYSVGGLTKRERAAIDLRVPMSGDDDIDAMIRAANRKDFAAMAMQGLLAGEYRDTSEKQLQWVSEWAVKHADALLAELERTA